MSPIRILPYLFAAGLAGGLPQPALAQNPAGNRPWNFTLSLTGSYEHNALFTGFDETSEFAQRVQATLARGWALRRGAASLSVSASKPFYRESTELNDFQYSFGGGLSHALTRRLTWIGNTTLTSGLARDAEVLTDAGLLLPSVTTRTASSTSAFSYMLSRRSQLTWSVAHNAAVFETSAFSGGSSLTSAVAYTRQVGGNQSLGITQDYSRTFAAEVDSNIYGLYATWSIAGRGGWAASASAGVRPYSVPAESGYRMSSTFAGSLTKMVRLGQTLNVSYSKSIEQSFGFISFGNRPVQTFSATYSLGLGRKVSSTFGGTYSRSTDPDAIEVIIGTTASGSITYRILENLSLMFGSTGYRRTDPLQDRVTSVSTYATLLYGVSW